MIVKLHLARSLSHGVSNLLAPRVVHLTVLLEFEAAIFSVVFTFGNFALFDQLNTFLDSHDFGRCHRFGLNHIKLVRHHQERGSRIVRVVQLVLD